MAYLPKPQPCKNNCGAQIYFDKDSQVGHPEADKRIPLVFNGDTGVYTGEPHNCPKRQKYGNGSSRVSSDQNHSQENNRLEQIHNLLASMDGKLDRLLNLAERK